MADIAWFMEGRRAETFSAVGPELSPDPSPGLPQRRCDSVRKEKLFLLVKQYGSLKLRRSGTRAGEVFVLFAPFPFVPRRLDKHARHTIT